MRKQLTFQGATTYFPFPTKWLLGKKHKNSILKRFPYPDLGNASDWSYCEGNLLQLIRSTTQIFTVFNKVWGGENSKELPIVFNDTETSFCKASKNTYFCYKLL